MRAVTKRPGAMVPASSTLMRASSASGAAHGVPAERAPGAAWTSARNIAIGAAAGAVARGVRHHDADAAVFRGQEVVVVAARARAGDIRGVPVVAGDVGVSFGSISRWRSPTARVCR